MRKLMMCVIPVLALGCDGDGAGATCTTELVYSVSVSVDDDAGDPVEGATVQYSVDGGTARDCEEWSNGDYACGEEIAGDITVTATADGFGSDEETVTVEADECHVLGESVALTLAIQD